MAQHSSAERKRAPRVLTENDLAKVTRVDFAEATKIVARGIQHLVDDIERQIRRDFRMKVPRSMGIGRNEKQIMIRGRVAVNKNFPDDTPLAGQENYRRLIQRALRNLSAQRSPSGLVRPEEANGDDIHAPLFAVRYSSCTTSLSLHRVENPNVDPGKNMDADPETLFKSLVALGLRMPDDEDLPDNIRVSNHMPSGHAVIMWETNDDLSEVVVPRIVGRNETLHLLQLYHTADYPLRDISYDVSRRLKKTSS